MTCSLFHCFDPSVFFYFFILPMKGFIIFFFFFFLSWQVFNLTAGIDLVLKKLVLVLWDSFLSLIKRLDRSFLMLFSVILMIYGFNVLGLVPFVFTYTSHLSTNLSFSLSLWLGGVLMSIFSSIDSFLSHMVPTGTPLVLWIFLVLVESVSQIIRPFTLSIRLMANVMAGHLIMNLFGMFISSNSLFFFLLMFQGMFLVFEHCVSLVQAYVFTSLLALYWDES